MKDELTDEDHLDMLNNSDADIFGRLMTFKDYVKLGFEIEKAKKMAGLKNYDFSKNEELQKFIEENTKNVTTLTNDNLIAEFRDSIYKNGFGFDVSVYINNNSIVVKSDCLLAENYDNFEDFIEDLAEKNPFWHTYYYVRINKEYQKIVEKKLEEKIEKVFDNLNRSITNTSENWIFDEDAMDNFVKNKIKKLIDTYYFDLLKTKLTEKEVVQTDLKVISKTWNGYCPESWLKGKQVKMRLNKNDFYESEETGLQIAVLSGVQAIILNFRGNGDFRSIASYAHDIENGEILSPQNTERSPFNKPAVIFESGEEIINYLNQIPK